MKISRRSCPCVWATCPKTTFSFIRCKVDSKFMCGTTLGVLWFELCFVATMACICFIKQSKWHITLTHHTHTIQKYKQQKDKHQKDKKETYKKQIKESDLEVTLGFDIIQIHSPTTNLVWTGSSLFVVDVTVVAFLTISVRPSLQQLPVSNSEQRGGLRGIL